MSIAAGSPNHKHAGGRPPKYKTLLELETAIQAYFEECEPHPVMKWVQEEFRRKDGTKTWKVVKRQVLSDFKPPTMAGLAICLGMSRQALMEYKNDERGKEFGDAIKRARAKVGEFNEQRLLSGQNVAGAIFNLKVNWGYKENNEENPPPENPIIFINNVPIDGPGEQAQPVDKTE